MDDGSVDQLADFFGVQVGALNQLAHRQNSQIDRCEILERGSGPREGCPAAVYDRDAATVWVWAHGLLGSGTDASRASLGPRAPGSFASAASSAFQPSSAHFTRTGNLLTPA